MGDSWTIEYTTPEGMCLGAWGAIHSYVMALNLGGSITWTEEPSKVKIPCADPKGITLLVERIE